MADKDETYAEAVAETAAAHAELVEVGQALLAGKKPPKTAKTAARKYRAALVALAEVGRSDKRRPEEKTSREEVEKS